MKWLMGVRKALSIVTAAAVAMSPAVAGPALLFDPANGRILYAEDQDDQWFPAAGGLRPCHRCYSGCPPASSGGYHSREAQSAHLGWRWPDR